MKTNIVTSKRVALVTGGWSDERDVALSSAASCEKALKEAGFTEIEQLDVADSDFMARVIEGKYDVAFIAMHGRYGEDGCVQGLFEVLHIPYTFSGVTASAVACDKALAKLVYDQAGIPTAQGMTVHANDPITEELIKEIVTKLGLPLFVKPMTNGSSFGITKVHDISTITEALHLACKDGDNALIESCVEGMEVTAPVVGNTHPKALPIIEIVTGAEFYDLKVKYEPSELHHVIPARIDESIYKRTQELAVRAHQALGCKGASRSDFIIREDGTPVILETNTIPGMTETSLLPDAARHAGIAFPDLCRMFIELALEDE